MRNIEQETGLIFAGHTRACGMDIEVYTKTGAAPLWSNAADPAPFTSPPSKESTVRTVVGYAISSEGREYISKGTSKSDPKFAELIDMMRVIDGGTVRQIDICKAMGLKQARVWYIARKLTSMGLIMTREYPS